MEDVENPGYRDPTTGELTTYSSKSEGQSNYNQQDAKLHPGNVGEGASKGKQVTMSDGNAG